MKLRDIMTKDISAAYPDSTVQEVAQQMKDLNIGSVPVIKNGEPVGMVTDRDIVLRNVSENKDDSASTVEEIMTDKIVYGSPDMDVDEAAFLMSKHQIRRLPIVENNKLIGMVSLGDLATTSELSDEAGKALSSISRPSQPQM